MGTAQEATEIEIDPARVAEWLEQDPTLQVIDVRELYEREAGYVEGSRHVALTELQAQQGSFERERPMVFYCRLGARSDMAAQAFRQAGFEAYSMSGGLQRWAHEGLPLSPAGGHVANH